MPQFSAKSEERLKTCDERIQKVMREAIKHVDFTVLAGHRGKEEQDAAFHDGNSKLRWPMSKHNSFPSMAIDVAPVPIDWKNRERFYFLAGRIIGIAAMMGVKLRYGGDWNSNGETKDEMFSDLVHFEIVGA